MDKIALQKKFLETLQMRTVFHNFAIDSIS